MGNKKPYTPNSRLKAALHRLFLRSRERALRLKQDKYTCQRCGVKQSRASGKEVYVEVHHRHGVLNWVKIYNCIREYLLVSPDKLETLCHDCHHKEHEDKEGIANGEGHTMQASGVRKDV